MRRLRVQAKKHDKNYGEFKGEGEVKSEIRWESKPDGVSITTWRRSQVWKYLREHPDAKGKAVLVWIFSHDPNP